LPIPSGKSFYVGDMSSGPSLRIKEGWATLTFASDGGMYGDPYVIRVTPWTLTGRAVTSPISASGRNLPTHRRWTAVVRFLMMEAYEGKYLVGALRIGEQVGERLRLLGAWHTLRGVTGKTIDPAW
jgi:hypothetical protein